MLTPQIQTYAISISGNVATQLLKFSRQKSTGTGAVTSIIKTFTALSSSVVRSGQIQSFARFTAIKISYRNYSISLINENKIHCITFEGVAMLKLEVHTKHNCLLSGNMRKEV